MLREAYVFTKPFEHARGLMLRKQKPAVFLFPKDTRSAFHSFFFTHGFGMISCDASGSVVEVRVLKPWRVWKPRKAYRAMLEIPLVGEWRGVWEELIACLAREGGLGGGSLLH